MEEIRKYTCKCESCHREFDEEEFQITKDENKCILHCEKDDWYKKFDEKSDRYKIQKYFFRFENNNWSLSKNKIDFFWKELNITIKKRIEEESLEFSLNNVNFPAMTSNTNFLKSPIYNLKLIKLKNCVFLDAIDLSYFLDAKNLEITRCTFYEDIIIENVIHKGQFIFQNNTILKNIKFFNLEFKDTCVFILNKFKKELTFDDVRFNEYAVFNNSEIEDFIFQKYIF